MPQIARVKPSDPRGEFDDFFDVNVHQQTPPEAASMLHEKWVSEEEAASILDITRKKLSRRIKKRKLETKEVDGTTLVKLELLADYAQSLPTAEDEAGNGFDDDSSETLEEGTLEGEADPRIRPVNASSQPAILMSAEVQAAEVQAPLAFHPSDEAEEIGKTDQPEPGTAISCLVESIEPQSTLRIMDLVERLTTELATSAQRVGYLESKLEAGEQNIKLIQDIRYHALRERGEELQELRQQTACLEEENRQLRMDVDRYRALTSRSPWTRFCDWMMGRSPSA